MKLKTKKIIAREFLILIVCLLFSVIFFIGIFVYNYVIEIKIRNTEKSIIPINEEIQSFEKLKDEKLSKQKWFFEEGIESITPGVYNFSEVWEKMEYYLKNDSIIYGWEYDWTDEFKNSLKRIGFKNAQELEHFIKDNSIMLEDNVRIDSLHTEKLKLNDKINSIIEETIPLEDQFNLSLIVFIIIVTVSFPIRFLYILIQWSFKTLKQKE